MNHIKLDGIITCIKMSEDGKSFFLGFENGSVSELESS